MIKTNDIDIFLLNEELFKVFQELITQFNKNKEKIYFNLINTFNNNINLITIFDPISLEYVINKKLALDNHIFIIGNIGNEIKEKLDNEYINYESIETPLNIFYLLEKCKNLIKQQNDLSSEIISYKKFKYSFHLNTIYAKDNSLYLTDKENEIFQFLIENKEDFLNKKKLLAKVWNYADGIDTHTLETHIYTLRKKIKKKLNLVDLICHEDNGYYINKKLL